MALRLGDRGTQARVQGLRQLRTGRVRSREEDERQEDAQIFAAEEARKQRKFQADQGSFLNTLKRAFSDSLGRLPLDTAKMGLGELMPSSRATADYRKSAAKAMKGQEMRAMEPFLDKRVHDYIKDKPWDGVDGDEDAYRESVRRMMRKKYRR